MLAFDLSEEQFAVQAMARAFADGEIRPVAERLDRSQQLLQDFPWPLVRKGSELGLRSVGLPREYGGLEFDARTRVLLIDELAYADIACARIFSQNWKLCQALAICGTGAQKERFLSAFRDDDTFLFGMDDELPGEGALSAKRVGDHYVLNGRKRFVSLGPVAKLVFVHTSLGIFLVPAGAPGLVVAACHDRVGLRMDLQGELVFENANVPAGNLLGGKEGQSYDDTFAAASSIEVSAHAMAVARAALDAATQYATERVQGGKRIIEHQAVALALADMYIALQAGRSLLWRAAWELDNERVDRVLRMSCKLFCTQAAINICRNAVELFGGSGAMRELPMQKYFRDALVLPQLGATEHVDHNAIGATFTTGEAFGEGNERWKSLASRSTQPQQN